MNLIKTSFWSAIATVMRIMIGLLSNKIMAIYVGPAGVAMFGQFGNYVGMLTSIGSGATNAGVTKYIAEYGQDQEKQKTVIKNALGIALYCSVFIGAVNLIFAEKISIYLFNSTEYRNIFYLFGISVIFASINSVILSILNGYKKIKLFLIIGIISQCIGLILTYFLAVRYAVYGVLLSSVITQILAFFVSITIVRKFSCFNFSFIKFQFEREIVKNLSKYTLMAVTSALCVPISQIFVRNFITNYLSLEQAGHWQAVWKISEVYLMVVTISLSTYYLPRLSEITSKIELRKELIQGYKLLLPITVLMACGIYALREYIILILFTEKFMPMKDLFLFQLIGDVLKISAWLLGYIIVAKAMTKVFIFTEVIFSFSFVALSYIFINKFGLVGITYGYALNYLGYLLIVWLVVKKEFKVD